MRFSIAVLPALLAAPVFADPPKVVVDIAPVHALLSQVMEGVATPQLLLDQGDNPHSVQLKPSQARMLADADLVIWVGAELSPWLEDIVEMEADHSIELLAHPATYLRDFGESHGEHVQDNGHAHEGEGHDDHAHDAEGHDDHAHEAEGHDDHDAEAHGEEGDHAHDDHAEAAMGEDGDHEPAAQDHAGDAHGEDAHAGHDHSGADPHAWLTTENARAWVDVFADTLAEMDPDNAAVYRENAVEAVTGLDALEARMRERLAGHRGAKIVTFHDAYGYFEAKFDIEVAGSVRPGDASSPSAAAVAELKDLVADHGIECAFGEPAHDPRMLDAISGDTGLRIGTLDPTGTLQPIGPGHYAATLAAMAETIATCLEGG